MAQCRGVGGLSVTVTPVVDYLPRLCPVGIARHTAPLKQPDLCIRYIRRESIACLRGASGSFCDTYTTLGAVHSAPTYRSCHLVLVTITLVLRGLTPIARIPSDRLDKEDARHLGAHVSNELTMATPLHHERHRHSVSDNSGRTGDADAAGLAKRRRPRRFVSLITDGCNAKGG